MSFGV
ncbi:carbohydrate kinase superfamily, partial [Escherichia coli TW07945]